MNLDMLKVALGNAALSALIAPKGQRGTAAVVGGLFSYVGNVTGINASVGVALCPFSGEGRIGCVLPILVFPGAATGAYFRFKKSKGA